MRKYILYYKYIGIEWSRWFKKNDFITLWSFVEIEKMMRYFCLQHSNLQHLAFRGRLSLLPFLFLLLCSIKCSGKLLKNDFFAFFFLQLIAPVNSLNFSNNYVIKVMGLLRLIIRNGIIRDVVLYLLVLFRFTEYFLNLVTCCWICSRTAESSSRLLEFVLVGCAEYSPWFC